MHTANVLILNASVTTKRGTIISATFLDNFSTPSSRSLLLLCKISFTFSALLRVSLRSLYEKSAFLYLLSLIQLLLFLARFSALALNGTLRNQNQKRGFDLFLLSFRTLCVLIPLLAFLRSR